VKLFTPSSLAEHEIPQIAESTYFRFGATTLEKFHAEMHRAGGAFVRLSD
jgi:hypothetical protein